MDTELHPDTGLVFGRTGEGPPLVLIHGLGSNRSVWSPLLDGLRSTRDLILVDLPGFGETPPLPEDVEPTAQEMAGMVAHLIDDLGLGRPHVAGHSFGGWVALEVAALGRASTVTGLAPAGLWDTSAPWITRQGLRNLHRVAVRLGPLAAPLAQSRIARTALLWPQVARPWSVADEDAADAADGYANSPGFDRTLDTFVGRHFEGKASLDVPVSVAVGSRDLIIDRWRCQNHDLLPASARWTVLPGAGHVPMWDSPKAVTRILLDGSQAPLRPMRHPRSGRSV